MFGRVKVKKSEALSRVSYWDEKENDFLLTLEEAEATDHWGQSLLYTPNDIQHVFCPTGKVTRSQVPLECRVAVSSTIACFQSEWDRTSCTFCGTETKDNV